MTTTTLGDVVLVWVTERLLLDATLESPISLEVFGPLPLRFVVYGFSY